MILFLFAGHGLTFLLCTSTIFFTPRLWVIYQSKWLADLLACYFCTGFWAGMVLYGVAVVGLPQVGLVYPVTSNVLEFVCLSVFHGMAAASFSYVMHLVTSYLEDIRARDPAKD